MGRRLRISPQTLALLEALLQKPASWHHGYALSQQTNLASGTLYPILMRLEKLRWLETSWEQPGTAAGRPPRHLYRLTSEARAWAREELADAQKRNSGSQLWATRERHVQKFQRAQSHQAFRPHDSPRHRPHLAGRIARMGSSLRRRTPRRRIRRRHRDLVDRRPRAPPSRMDQARLARPRPLHSARAATATQPPPSPRVTPAPLAPRFGSCSLSPSPASPSFSTPKSVSRSGNSTLTTLLPSPDGIPSYGPAQENCEKSPNRIATRTSWLFFRSCHKTTTNDSPSPTKQSKKIPRSLGSTTNNPFCRQTIPPRKLFIQRKTRPSPALGPQQRRPPLASGRNPRETSARRTARHAHPPQKQSRPRKISPRRSAMGCRNARGVHRAEL